MEERREDCRKKGRGEGGRGGKGESVEKREGGRRRGGRNVGKREEGRGGEEGKERVWRRGREDGGEKEEGREKGEDEGQKNYPVSFLPSSLLSCVPLPVLKSSLDIWRANVSQSLRLKLNTITGCS